MSRMHRDRMSRPKKHGRFRLLFQLAAAVLFNGYIVGFTQGRIYTGGLKMICVPVLNCYSCPGALGSCPIGALQAVIGGAGGRFPFYVLGSLMLFGTVLGRLICGFLCPFGLIQDLLHKIPVRKIKVPVKADRSLRFVKYGILGIFVLLLPAVLRGDFGTAPPFFCKYICPAGTLEGGIPNVLANESLQGMIGALFNWKVGLLVFILLGSVFIHRFFCKYLCPLGAFYSLFQRFSLYRMDLDTDKCIGCGKCESVCPMQVEVRKNINSTECIRCGNCKAACPVDAISSGFCPGNIKKQAPKEQNQKER